MGTFSFNPPIKLSEEDKWIVAVTFFECTNSVFDITNEINSFSFSMPSYWRTPKNFTDGIIDRVKNLLKLKSENDIKLHGQEVRKKR